MSGTQLMATLRHVGKFYANDANTIELPQATTLELAAMQRLTDKITAGLRVRNATDKFYASWATDANYVIVAPKRSIEMTIRASF
jgi:iron complex outermembrane receptor protein